MPQRPPSGQRARSGRGASDASPRPAEGECFHRFARLTDRPRIEIVEVPYERGSLPAYFVHAENTDLARTPCVVFFDGLDITKELQYLRGVADLVRRGIACLIVDGPGTGEAIRFRATTCATTTRSRAAPRSTT